MRYQNQPLFDEVRESFNGLKQKLIADYATAASDTWLHAEMVTRMLVGDDVMSRLDLELFEQMFDRLSREEVSVLIFGDKTTALQVSQKLTAMHLRIEEQFLKRIRPHVSMLQYASLMKCLEERVARQTRRRQLCRLRLDGMSYLYLDVSSHLASESKKFEQTARFALKEFERLSPRVTVC